MAPKIAARWTAKTFLSFKVKQQKLREIPPHREPFNFGPQGRDYLLDIHWLWSLSNGPLVGNGSVLFLKQKGVYRFLLNSYWVHLGASRSKLNLFFFFHFFGHPLFFTFNVECISWYWIGRSDWKRETYQNITRSLEIGGAGNPRWRKLTFTYLD